MKPALSKGIVMFLPVHLEIRHDIKIIVRLHTTPCKTKTIAGHVLGS
jgi:hypothetical protein